VIVKGRAAGAAALGLLALAWSGTARASGVDGAGREVVLPLAFTGSPRESIVTLTNPNPHPLSVTARYFGAEGTPNAVSVAGSKECTPQAVPLRGSVTLLLRELCPKAFSPDAENFGFVVLHSDADGLASLFVTSTIEFAGISTAIVAEPLGDHDPGFAGQDTLGLEVGGLRRRKNQDERPVCFLSTLGEPKKVMLSLLDQTGASLATTVTVAVAADQMERVDLEALFGLAPKDEDDLRVTFASVETGLLVAGCGGEHKVTRVVAYQPAQTPEPADRSRLHAVMVQATMHPGPYGIGYPWWHVALGHPASRKVTLSTYLRPDDEVRCWLEPWDEQIPAGYDTTPWLELRVRDPKFNVIAGGSQIKDTGAFHTPPRGRLPSAAGDRYLIEISFDEDAGSWPHWPSTVPHPGGWQIQCRSAAGMSEPIPVPVQYLDDF
jgi:hypothetical protein